MDKSRQQFEVWFKKEYPLIESQPENTLLQAVKRQCLRAWQTSRERLEVELPNLGDVILDDYFIDGFNDAISEVEKILISNGVKIKNE
ncbi:hypothetical protein JEP15_11930 [Proteus sp. PR00174]|uniref:hypothetical protein n=1 Tax=Proteus sp. PR00174 TaxID=2794024 RepID=UPI0018E4466C|nr:hypothetical protein [Proteus sp. PR00174]MBI6512073.1 hypothetical protein [Proteus sp. PR00174]